MTAIWKFWLSLNTIFCDMRHITFCMRVPNERTEKGKCISILGKGHMTSSLLDCSKPLLGSICCQLLHSQSNIFAMPIQSSCRPLVTTYWCAAAELPREVQQRQQYVVRVSSRITIYSRVMVASSTTLHFS